ncbi:MAG: SAM-dependent methyltransferase [Betaproteobacteria bacterium]|nr:SAM-dependent methyltransferase [Betaproteobacteria bacterium]
MLPEPDADARAASARLGARIRAEIAAGGNWIGFARYMEMALHEPGLGYYAGGAAKLGAPGDFTTAPEMGTLFARTLARQVAEILQPGEAILEFGAGSGALAEALTAELAPQRYLILETSAELTARQRARLGERAQWIERLPARFRGVMLANEVADAMPVHALAWRREGLMERGVSEIGGALAWAERPAAGELREAARQLAVPVPYESEVGLMARAWVKLLAARLERGALLIVDYGFPEREYYHPQRAMGTLMCHYRHRAHGDVFFHPGLQDITAHVDFTALARAARESGLEVLGYANQMGFLVDCGITELLGREDAGDVVRYAPLAAEAQKLLSPAEMGELFKVLALGRGVSRPLLGFANCDRSHTL